MASSRSPSESAAGIQQRRTSGMSRADGQEKFHTSSRFTSADNDGLYPNLDEFDENQPCGDQDTPEYPSLIDRDSNIVGQPCSLRDGERMYHSLQHSKKKLKIPIAGLDNVPMPSRRTEHSPSARSKPPPSKDLSSDWFWIVGVMIVLFVALFVVMFQSGKFQQNVPMNITQLVDELYELETKFPTQTDDTWATIVSGVSDLYNDKPQKPCVLLLVSPDLRISTCLAKHIAKQTLKVARGDQNDPEVVDAGQLKGSHFDTAQEQLRNSINEKKALVLTNLQNLDGTLAAGLHILCDRENPAVRDALIIITMQSEASKAKKVERELTALWEKKVESDKLPALITRLTASVVALTAETNLPSDCGM